MTGSGLTANTDALHSCLEDLAAITGVQFAALADREGFLIDAVGPATSAVETAAAVAGGLAEVAARLGQELGQGGLMAAMVQFERGAVLVYPLGPTGAVVLGAERAGALASAWPRVNHTMSTLAQTL